MALRKKIYERVMARKRTLDDNDGEYDIGEFKGPKKMVSEYPPPKIRSGVRVIHDFPPGCGIIESHLAQKGERKPLIDANQGDLNNRKMTSHDKNKLVASGFFERKMFENIQPNELWGNRPSFGSRTAGKVKFWDSSESKESKYNVTVVTHKEQGRRERIKEAMIMFNDVHEQLSLENKSKPKEARITSWMVPMEAAKKVKQKMKWMDADKMLGSICGVEIGDTFRFRVQLQMVGLHCQPFSGVDYIRTEGRNLAISIVDSHCYSNNRESSDVLWYSGHGGLIFMGGKSPPPKHQKLERGNLALRNSKVEKNQIRVIRRLKRVGKNNEVFVYDGLYTVEDYTHRKDAHGRMIFMFELHRVPGQPPLLKMLNASRS